MAFSKFSSIFSHAGSAVRIDIDLALPPVLHHLCDRHGIVILALLLFYGILARSFSYAPVALLYTCRKKLYNNGKEGFHVLEQG